METTTTDTTLRLSRYELLDRITTFRHSTFGIVRVITIRGQGWIPLKEIKGILGMSNKSQLLTQIKEQDKLQCVLGFGVAANLITKNAVQFILTHSRSKNREALEAWLMPLLEEYESKQALNYDKFKAVKNAKATRKAQDVEVVTDNNTAVPTIPAVPQANNESIKLFSHEAFGKVRVIEKDGEPWFVAKDVCEVLEIKNSRDALAHLDEDEKGVVLTDTLGGKQRISLINEQGLYSLLMQSRKPHTKPFRKWVTGEVLPSIRKQGGYIHASPTDTPEVIMARALKIADSTIKDLQRKVAEDAPKVAFAEQVSGSEDSIHVGVLAKLLKQNGVNIGRDRLFERLRNDGFLIKEGAEKNLPTQRSMNAGYTEIKESTFRDVQSGYIHLKKTTLITGKGQNYFLQRYTG